MKKILFLVSLCSFFLCSHIFAYIGPNDLGDGLYNLIQGYTGATTKRQIVKDFCKTMTRYIDTNNQVEAERSVFLKILCNETGIYTRYKFAKKVKLQDSVKKYYQNVGNNKKLSFIGFKCGFKSILGREGSLNDWDFGCVATDIFDKLENDIFNLATFRILGGDISSDDTSLIYWEENIFGNKFCKNGYIDGYSDKNGPCNHLKTLKYLTQQIHLLRESVIKNAQIYNLEHYSFGGLYDFVTDYGYDSLDILASLKNISYDELYFYDLFLVYYSEALKKTYGVLEPVNAGSDIYAIYGKELYDEVLNTQSQINISLGTVNKTWRKLKELIWTYPLHIGFLAIQEDIKEFMKALAEIYTPLDQLRYKLINNQDLDKQ